jgi:hypothetical protein
MAKHYLLAFTNPVPGREAEFDRWYDERHMADLLAMPGFVSAQRFALSDATGQGEPRWTSLALYELDTDDPDQLMVEVRSRLGTNMIPVSDALDTATQAGLIATAITARLTARAS